MSNFSLPFVYLTSLDLYYLSASTNIFLYGLILMLTVGFVGNTCLILTFSRRTMKNVSTGVLFLALSVSDTMYLLLSTYNLIIYGFQVPDRSNYAQTCRLRHFISYLTTNFSAWMLTTSKFFLLSNSSNTLLILVACDRWLRSRFPNRAQQICRPRTAIYVIIIALIIDCGLHSHLLTPMFGQIAPGVTTTCGVSRFYPEYLYFYVEIWPMITILTVTILPASLMMMFVIAIGINVRNSRNRVIPMEQTGSQHERRRARFLHRQMLILMLVTVILFFVTTFPVAVFRFAVSTLGIQQSFAFNLFLAAVFGLITISNYSLNFYLHCLTSKLFRREFFKIFPCSISIHFRPVNVPRSQQHLTRPQKEGTLTQLMGRTNISNTYALDKNCVTTV